jgi:hypothetical protein
MFGEGLPRLPVPGRQRIHTIAELAYLIDPIIRVDSRIAEARSAIPLCTTISPAVMEIAEACAVIFRRATRYGIITEIGSSICGFKHR